MIRRGEGRTIRPSNEFSDSSYQAGPIPVLKMAATVQQMQTLLPGALVDGQHLLQLPDDIGH
jgi:hypothetical protein